MASGHGVEEARCTSATQILATILTSVTACQISLSAPGARINPEQKGTKRNKKVCFEMKAFLSSNTFLHRQKPAFLMQLRRKAQNFVWGKIKPWSTQLMNCNLLQNTFVRQKREKHARDRPAVYPLTATDTTARREGRARQSASRRTPFGAVLADAANGLLLSWLIKAKSELGTPD